MILQKDNVYEFTYVRTFQTRNGITFFEVSLDNENYNVFPRPYQIENPPQTIKCKVRDIEENGYVKLTQDYDWIIGSYFKNNEFYEFIVMGEERIVESGQMLFKVKHEETGLDFNYLEQEDDTIILGQRIRCRVSVKTDIQGIHKVRLYSGNRSMDGYRPEEVFALIEHSELYSEFYENLVVDTDNLEDVFDEMIDKVENNNRLWIFDYIRILKAKASLYCNSDNQDLEKAIQCNYLILDLENWMLESDFMSNFSPATRAENLVKAETTISNAESDIEALNLVKDNKHIEFINELLARLKARKVIRKKESVYRKLFKILSTDQNLFDNHLKEIAEVISITSNEVIDVDYLNMIVSKFNWVVKEKKKQLNISIHYQRNQELDPQQLTSLVICIGILITIYQKEESLIPDTNFNIRTAFTDLCKYLSLLTTPEKGRMLMSKALSVVVSKDPVIPINGSKLIDIDNNVESFIDSVLQIEVEVREDTLCTSVNNVQIQYQNGELLIIPTFKKVRILIEPKKVYNIPNTNIFICSMDPSSTEWEKDNDVSYYKSQWANIQDINCLNISRPKENDEVRVKVKMENTQPYGVFCYIDKMLTKEDGLITKYDYLNGLVDCENMPIYFKGGLTLPARIHYNSKNQINLSIKDYLYDLSYEIASQIGDTEQVAVCLKKAGKDAWFITNNHMLCRAKLKMSHSVKEGACYRCFYNNEEYEVPGINILGPSSEEYDSLTLLQDQLKKLAKKYKSIKEYNPTAKGLPRILLIIDNYIRLANDDVVRYNLYHVAKLISTAESSELANYYSARINYINALNSIAVNSEIGLDIAEATDDISSRFPSLQEQSEVLSILKALGSEDELSYLFAVANNDDKTALITKLSRLVLASNLMSLYGAPNHITDGIRKFIVSELGAYTPTQYITESEEAIEEDVTETDNKYYGIENQLQEFKTSVVYFAGDNSANPKEQFKVILRTITGFLNAKGGVLWIGVADNGYASGIEPDLMYFDANTDKYERLIRHEIVKSLDKDINGTISIEFLEDAGKTICKITIPPYFRPVSYNDEFYIRQGNETRIISGNALIMFIERRLHDKRQGITQSIPSQEFDIDMHVEEGNPSDDDTPRSIIDIDNEGEITSAGRLAQETTGLAYLNMYIDGTYMLTDFPVKDTKVLFSEKIPTENCESLSLLLCYNNGCVNRMNIPTILCKQYNYRYSNGLYKNADLMKAFIADESDYVSLVSTAIDKKYIKVYPIADISDHTSIGLKGNQIISQNFHTIESWNIIEGKYIGYVEKLVYTSRSGIGKNINSSYYNEERQWLINYFRGLRNFDEKNVAEISNEPTEERTKKDILVKAIEERSESGIQTFLIGCEGHEIHRYRDIVTEVLLDPKFRGESFWFAARCLMSTHPGIFRRTLTSVVKEVNNISLFKTSESNISSACKLFLGDEDKIVQALEFFDSIKEILPIDIKVSLISTGRVINTPEGYKLLFKVLDANINQKIHILSQCNSNAGLYTLYDVLSKHEREYGLSSVKRINNISNVLNELQKTDEGNITYNIIQKTVYHIESAMSNNDTHKYLIGGFETFNTALIKLRQRKEHKELLKSIGDNLNKKVTARVMHIFNDIAMCTTTDGFKAILPAACSSTTLKEAALISCYVTWIDFKENVLFLTTEKDIRFNKRDYNFVSVGDELEVRFAILNNTAVPSVLGCSWLKAKVDRYPRNFDFRKKYTVRVSEVLSFNSCIINNLSEVK